MVSTTVPSTAAPRVVVLDDDPTGSQEAQRVPVLLTHDAEALETALRGHRTVFVITNSRALDEAASVRLHRELARTVAAVTARTGEPVDVVLRGDSTLRGHVFAESEVFESPGSVLLLCPAFPSGGRRTVDGVHQVRVDRRWHNAADTEFARDPVFGFTARSMVDYVRERSGRPALVADATTLDTVVTGAPGGTVVAVDAATDADLASIATTVRSLWSRGIRCVVRSAAPLAANLGGVRSAGPVQPPVAHGPVLVVTGSHTAASTAQLARLAEVYGPPLELDTERALRDPTDAAAELAARARERLGTQRVVTVATQRARRTEHSSLADGAAVMRALTGAVRLVADLPAAVVAKGGITSYEVARSGLGVRSALVAGQVAPGVSLWELDLPGRALPYVVVPGNVGAADTMLRIVQAMDESVTCDDIDDRAHRRSAREGSEGHGAEPPGSERGGR